MDRMSPNLKAEVAYAAYANWIRAVPYFALSVDLDEGFIAALCLNLKSKVYAQGEPFGDI